MFNRRTFLTTAAAGATMLAGVGSTRGFAKSNPNIALLLYSRGFEFMVALDQGAHVEAQKLGVNLTTLEGQSNTEVQLRQIEDLLVKGVDAIVLAANNSNEIVPGVRHANEAKVPVVAVDSVVGKGADVVSYVGFDNAGGGKVGGEYLAKHGGITKVLELQGALGAYHAQRRHEGFVSGVSGYTVISRPAEWLAENAQSITADVLTAQPDVNAIFSHNDEMIRGVLAGLRQIGRDTKVGDPKHIVICGVDGTPLALQRIRNGEQDATVNQDPFEMGSLAVRSAVMALNKEPVPPQQLLPPTLVTRANVGDDKLWGNRFKA